ncbi:NADH-quinone oxidoreductase subunit B family protein [Archaeoglobus neptunius]|uniref:NADH-quinone oxidoreductase subunit B family protein n=1 Tax=Archaeoglobus neptunius TaxID=2798580 RepID=UPI001927C3BF|nr:F420-nonreducing hydrogenase [Archaeoglobus neptunius]
MVDVAIYLAAGCSGCELSLLDLGDRLADLNFRVIWASPTLGDGKYGRIPEVDIAFVEGGVRLDEQERIVRELRRKSDVLVAFGICAACGGVPGLANLHSKDEILEGVFRKGTTTDNPESIIPQKTVFVDGKYELTLPEFYENVRAVDQIVEVDCYIGGCPPTPGQIEDAVSRIIGGEVGWITTARAVCESCPYELGDGMEGAGRFTKIVSGECFLKKGILCFGPATQGDCGASCPKVNTPCRGCGGPLPAVSDYGAKIVDMLSLLLDEKGVEELGSNYHTIAKLIYLYSMASATIPGRVRKYHVREIE